MKEYLKKDNGKNIFSINKSTLENIGIFAINKPLNWTSNDIVQYLKKYYKFKKVGHGGTLDPFATGVLVIAINENTKKLNEIINHDKKYYTKIKLGILTKSLDMESEIIKQKPFNKSLTQNDVINAIEQFKKEYWQTPPIFSAKKINGVRSYKLARANSEIKLNPVKVEIKEYELVNLDSENGIIELILNVSKGFYIRSFSNDLAMKLNTVGSVQELCRLKQSKWDLNSAFAYIKK